MAKVIAAVAVVVALPLLVILLVSASPAQQAPAGTGLGGVPTATATAGIPAAYLAWYMNAAPTCPGLPWPVLAGIGTVESDNGQSDLPGVRSGANYAGAEGPMQFEPATFAQYATGPDQPLSIYDPADAIYTAAAMLCAKGARGGSTAGIEQAIFAYDHADWYVSEVMSWAARYATQSSSHAAGDPRFSTHSDGTAAHAGHVVMSLSGGQVSQGSAPTRPTPSTSWSQPASLTWPPQA